MNKLYFKYILLLPIYILLQIFVLNQILFSAYINPFLYILLIISLPLKTQKWFLLIYSFLLGYFVDLFSSSIGFHSTASVLIAFLKPALSRVSIPHNVLAETDEITLQKIGVKSYLVFSLLLTLIHHSCLFMLEHVEFNTDILGKIIVSSIITLTILLITQLLIWREK